MTPGDGRRRCGHAAQRRWLLGVLPGLFAAIALFGGSSTCVGLCLGFATGLAMMALVNLSSRRPLGLTPVLGAGGGLLAIIDTITLITKHIDFLALVVFLAAGRW